VSWLKVETPDDLEKRLRGVGHSHRAVKEIMRWYKQNDSDRKV
jgi:hypothetical protein